MQEKPLVGIIMGSQSDWPILSESAKTLKGLKISFDADIVSAHRTPDKLHDYARNAEKRGIQIIIAGAGGAAHLPGMMAAMTRLPVLGVPIPSSLLDGLDSLLSIVQMPAGIPVGTLAVGKAGAINAALLAAAILANNNPEICERLNQYRAQQTQKVLDNSKPQLESL
ncbi:5-(carboxyamino)imidazole ribonucleotide mutase [Legionella sp. PATHC035]|uniref:5-(carboxyamino)imidazole ribonucleotide mutase n=1 Tax=Legionella sp. PATHC035 TaxID=2992040 RepID=UPI002243BF28|nr:5-(carboxyamino)imidazole ribonucleotide mutase [Legionella sp. PATHC035]MCW8408881.1 5-(carboxyamino)imidazole ribonucleotide mutase [Legionella sp. PATHC035]